MNHKLFGGFTASLLIATVGVSLPGQANAGEAVSQDAEPNPPNPNWSDSANESDASDSKPNSLILFGEKLGQPSEAAAGSSLDQKPASQLNASISSASQSRRVLNSHSSFQKDDSQARLVPAGQDDVEKVGEQLPAAASSQSAGRATPASDEVIAKVHSHEISGRKAATLYVRNIPVLTFMGSTTAATGDVKVGVQRSERLSSDRSSKSKSFELATGSLLPSLPSLLKSAQKVANPFSTELNPTLLETSATDLNPVWKATVVAAKLNQLYRSGLDADKITVSWVNAPASAKGSRDRFLIQSDDITLAVLDSDVVSPDAPRGLERDVLQATNRLRRILGGATPLAAVAGKPSGWQAAAVSAFGAVQARLTGMASWYGPGFHGNQSASGEIFNENAMTAAHRTLPFGTRVRVTNMDNGQSVVVRINDRGPFHGNRVIDLSTAAARMLGLIHSGVAPVQVEVLSNQTAAVPNN
jgi:rare lipoprotein A